MTLLLDADFFVRFVQLPPHFGGFSTPNDDGTYSVYIDPSKPDEVQIDAYHHEVDHLLHDDFDADADPVEAEKRMA